MSPKLFKKCMYGTGPTLEGSRPTLQEVKYFQNYHKSQKSTKDVWGIETGYACIEKLRPRTTSPNHSVRLLMFYFPLIFYNTWIVTNCIKRDESNSNGKPIIPIELLKCFFRLFVIQMIRNEKQEYFLEYVG